MSKAYYNEIDPFAAEWIRQLIKAGHVAPGDVDERDIRDIKSEDLAGYTQCHFFAGIGVWSYSLRRAGWPDDQPVWTGSCPCQPFSTAGKGKGEEDQRHLWPAFFGLIRQSRPPIVFGEQVAAAIGHGWLDLVQSDLESESYSFGKAILGACSVGAPHIRQRLYFVADARSTESRWISGIQRKEIPATRGNGEDGIVADTNQIERGRRSDSQLLSDGSAAQRYESHGKPEPNIETGVALGDTDDAGLALRSKSADGGRVIRFQGSTFGAAEPVRGFWGGADWIYCRDGKYRPVEPVHVEVVDGTPPSMGRLCSDQKESEKVNAVNPNANLGKKVQGLRENHNSPQDERGSDGSQGFQSENLLQPLMHGEGDGRADKSTERKELPQAVLQDGKCNLPKLRQGEGSTACASPGREPHEQRECQLGDALRFLPQSLSLAELYGDRRSESSLYLLRDAFLQEAALLPASVSAEEVWASLSQEAKNRIKLVFDASRWELVVPFPLSRGSHSRVGRLRGYGNAICAEVAKEFITAYLETQEEEQAA